MFRYVIKRILVLIPLLLGISIVTFAVIHLTPGKPTEIMLDMQARVSSETRERLIKLYELDKPVHIQYFKWLSRLIRLDFGNSLKDDRPVLEKIKERLPATLLLNVLSLILIFVVALAIGVKSACRHGAFFDKAMTVFVFIGFSVPGFWLSLMMMTLFGIKWGILPISGLHSINADEMTAMQRVLDTAKHLVLPVCVSAFGGLAGFSRYVRNEMLEVLSQDYIRTARAKGLPEHIVIRKHALRNALIPVITLLGLSLPDLIGGSFIFETIFAYPGMGRLGFEAVMSRDYPLIMGVGVLAAFLTLLGNLLADIAYAYADPRIRYK